ncbi:general substrate transporter [Mytilinidion resinicola]|uniref:General substrate transporter n=1 Tax=Mytilinidion resinicola TaxID=574789 RepID=A0A6A6Z6V0_9PEZI|nr:general substrate transporter [Mytilinidion resinicola]KAF2816821.1 general substrate transporter [Mytilinidion resinicola]
METNAETSISKDHRGHYKASTVWRVTGVSFGSLSLGYAAAIIATTLGQPSFFEYMNLATAKNASQIIGAMNSLFYAGGFFGCVFNAWFADRFGRRIAIATACVIVCLSLALQAGSVHVAMFIVFRFTNGFGNLMLMNSIPLWITEFVPPYHRGALSNIHAAMINIGYLVSSYVGVGFYYYTGGSGNQWRAPLALGCLFPLITLAVMPFIPESPRYLLTKDKIDEAWDIVREMHSSSDDPNHEFATVEFYQMKKQLEIDSRLDSSWIGMLRRPSYRKRLYISSSLLVLLYCTGTLTIANYGPILFKSLGFSPSQVLLFQAGNILQGLSAVIASIFIVDRFPRPTLLATGMLVCAVNISIVAALTATYLGTTNTSGLAAAVAFIFVYVWCYGFILDGVGYFYAAELFPTHLRAKGVTCCLGAYCLINILWLQVAPTAFDNIGWKFYMVFVSCAVVGAGIAWTWFPDTSHCSLEEVARLFGDEDLVAVYREEIVLDKQGGGVVEKPGVEHREEEM